MTRRSKRRKSGKDKVPNYLAECLSKALKISPGRVGVMDIFHDDWCDQLAGKGPCNCDPYTKLRLVPSPEDN